MSDSTVFVRRPQMGPMGRIIRIAIITMTVALVFASSVNVVMGNKAIAILYALGAPLGVSAWGFARVGLHAPAVVLLSLVLSILVTLTLYLSPMGVHNHAVIAYSGVLLFNALLLSRPQFIAMACVVLGMGALVFVLEALGLTGSGAPAGRWSPLFDFLLITGVMGGLARVVAEILYGSLGDAQQVAIKDPTTGVSNRQRFMSQAGMKLRGLDSDEFGVLMLVDLDNFRRTNHVVGHGAADRILAETAKRCQAIAPDVLVGRIGDDEFAVLAVGMQRESEAEALVHRLGAAVCFEHLGVAVTCSVGASHAPREGKTVEQLLSHADEALALAKRGARSSRSKPNALA